MGLVWQPSNPAAMISGRLCVIAEAVTATTGIPCVLGSLRRCRKASIPFMPGSWMSITTRSGGASRASRIPSSAVSVSTVR